MLLDGVWPSFFVKAYGGSPPPFDQPGLVALLKSKAVVGCDGGEGGEGGGVGGVGGVGGEGGGGGEVSWGSRRRSRAPSTPPVIVDSCASPVSSLSPEPG